MSDCKHCSNFKQVLDLHHKKREDFDLINSKDYFLVSILVSSSGFKEVILSDSEKFEWGNYYTPEDALKHLSFRIFCSGLEIEGSAVNLLSDLNLNINQDNFVLPPSYIKMWYLINNLITKQFNVNEMKLFTITCTKDECILVES